MRIRRIFRKQIYGLLVAHRRFALWRGLAAGVALLLLTSAWAVLELSRGETPDPAQASSVLAEFRKDFLTREKADVEFSLESHWHHRISEELLKADGFLPDLKLLRDLAFQKAWSAASRCKPGWQGAVTGLDSSSSQTSKLTLWWRSFCEGSSLPSDFFATAPLLHPLGGTWVAWAYLHPFQGFKPDSRWLMEHQHSLHLLELGLLPALNITPAERALSSLGPEELESFHQGVGLLLTPYSAILLYSDKNGDNRYRAFNRTKFENSLARSGLRLDADVRSSCISTEGRHCWKLDLQGLRDKRRIQLIILTLSLIGILTSLSLLLMLRHLEVSTSREDHELMVQTLAHELRHPATSIQLSLEVLRSGFDHLPEDEKVEILRMSEQTQRLQRLIHASRQYLTASPDPGNPFRFNWVMMESFNDYMEDVLEPYRAKIEWVPATKDFSFAVDPYWLSLCISNLVKNALMHGAPPVVIRVTEDASEISIVVEDSRATQATTLEELKQASKSESSSMGVGLTIVERIVGLMDGELELKAGPPKSLTLVIRKREGFSEKATRLAG